jgi:hypothetical protein
MTECGRRAEQCRLKAKDCKALAEVMADRDSSKQLRATAHQWLELAEQVELLDRVDTGFRRS